MGSATGTNPKLTTPEKVSFWIIAGMLVAAGALHMATPLLAALFSYFALTRLHFFERWGKWPAIILFLILAAGLTFGVGHFIRQTVRALPEIADKAVPPILLWAEQHQVELPFTDYESLKEVVLESIKNQANYLAGAAKFARGATTEFVFLIVGLVVAIGLFLNPCIERGRKSQAIANNLYSLCCDALERRFGTFYESFATVMGAQIIISAINTVFTGIFVVAMGMPYKLVVIGGTFFCGLLPVVGNLVSNTVLVGIGFTMSPRTALIALVFLVVIHKLEYLLNSKIVGDRIRNPLWLTLLALVLGERLMGIPGMILAPVVLNYVRLEASKIEVARESV